ncbi:MAG: hypothetical protein AB7O78_01655 [Thermoleophilia bacterium]
MSTRDLRVRFVGDAAGLKSSFAEANAATSGFSTGVGKAAVSSESAGKSITRTGKLFKAGGKFIKSSGLDAASAGAGFLSTIPALSGMSSSMGALITQATALTPVLAGLSGPAGLGLLVAGAAAVGVAFIAMRGDTETATAALRRMGDANKWVKDAHVLTARAAINQKEAVEGLGDALLSQEGAALSLEQAQKDLAAATKEYGAKSLEARSAALQVKQAEDSVKDSRREAVKTAQAAIAASERRAKATDAETRQVARQREEAEKLDWGLKRGLVTGKDREAVERKVTAALNAGSQASKKAEARHRANAAESKKAADMLNGQTNPALVALRKQLIAASNTELDMANAIAAMRNLAGAAGTAASGVQHVYDLLRNPPPVPGLGSFPGGGGKGGGKKTGAEKTSDSLETARRLVTPRRGELPPLSFTDIASGIIDRRHRDDSLQDKVAASRARSDAASRGISNPDKISAMEDKRVAELRKKEVQADINTVKRQRSKLRTRIVALRKRLASQRAARRNAKKDDQPKLDAAIADTISRIRGLWDQDRAMARDLAELQAEAKELGYDIQVLGAQINDLPDAVPEDDTGGDTGDTGPGPITPEEALDNAAALAALTPDVNDDIAVAEQAVAHYERSLAAAQAAGDVRGATAAAQALLNARTTLDQLKATRDNTDAVNDLNDTMKQGFGGSTVFGYRGQDYVLRSLAPPSSDDLRAATI